MMAMNRSNLLFMIRLPSLFWGHRGDEEQTIKKREVTQERANETSDFKTLLLRSLPKH